MSDKAVISLKSMRIANSLSVEVDNENSWRKVEKGVERWMLQSKKEIIVKLTILYMKTGGTNAENSDDDTASSKKVQPLLYWLNFAKNRVPKPVLKSFSKRFKSRANIMFAHTVVQACSNQKCDGRNKSNNLLKEHAHCRQPVD